MRQLKNDVIRSDLPAATVLTPDQLAAVTAGISAMLERNVGSSGPVIITGALPPNLPILGPQVSL